MLILTLLLAAPAAPLPPSPLAASAATRPADSYDALAAEFETAVLTWREELRSGDKETRKKLRSNRPAKAFWARFDALAKEDGRALLWMLQNAGDAIDRRTEADATRAELYERAVSAHRDAEWLPELLEDLAADKSMARRYGDEAVTALLERVERDSGSATNRAAASYRLGLRQAASEDEAQQAKGIARLERVVALGEKSEFAEPSAEFLYDFRNLRVGRVAPDLVSKTVDGQDIKLSDYRGKVVVLDFFGFW